jgi:hypothetical protein
MVSRIVGKDRISHFREMVEHVSILPTLRKSFAGEIYSAEKEIALENDN